MPTNPPTRTPNWAKWRHIPNARVWQAVALSLSIDPDKVKHSPHSWRIKRHLFCEDSEFKDRIDIACTNLGHPGGIVSNSTFLGGTTLDDRTKYEVSLPQFAEWAMRIGWEIPSELVELAETAPSQSIGQKGVSSGLAPDSGDKVLDARERTSLLIIIKALAENAKIDLSHVSKAAGQIEAMTVFAGARVAARTIEDHLKRIPDAFERKAK